MQLTRRQFGSLLLAAAGGGALSAAAGCGKKEEKGASTQDLVAQLESAGKEEKQKIVDSLCSRGEAAIPEILQAFEKTAKPETQQALADAVYAMPGSKQKTDALKKMLELAKDPGVREALGRFVGAAGRRSEQ